MSLYHTPSLSPKNHHKINTKSYIEMQTNYMLIFNYATNWHCVRSTIKHTHFLFLIILRSYMESLSSRCCAFIHRDCPSVTVNKKTNTYHLAQVFYCCLRHAHQLQWVTESEELQWDHHDQFIERKRKKREEKLQQSKRLSYHFCRFLFWLFMACYTFRSAGWVLLAVRVCVSVRVWEVVVHDVTGLKLACKTSWPFVRRSQQQSRKSFKWHYTQMKRKQHALSRPCKTMPDTEIPCRNADSTRPCSS